MLGAEPVDQPPRRLARGGVEPQIERPAGREAEPPLGVGQLIARQAQVQDHAVHLADVLPVQHLGQVAEVGLHEPHRQAGQARPRPPRSPRSRGPGQSPAPSGPTRSASARAWPPPPRVPSTIGAPGRGWSHSTTSSRSTETCTEVNSAMTDPKQGSPTSGTSLCLSRLSARGHFVAKATSAHANRGRRHPCPPRR